MVPFLNVKVTCIRYHMMTSEIYQLAVLFLNCLRWLSWTKIQVVLLHRTTSLGLLRTLAVDMLFTQLEMLLHTLFQTVLLSMFVP